MYEIRSADFPPLTKGGVLFLFSIVWGFISFGMLYIVGFQIISFIVCAIGLPIWMLLLRREGRINKFLLNQRSNFIKAKKGFCCQQCSNEIEKPIKNQNIEGQPIIYLCNNCSILWFLGSVDKSTS